VTVELGRKKDIRANLKGKDLWAKGASSVEKVRIRIEREIYTRNRSEGSIWVEKKSSTEGYEVD